jgi:hypothetical protein
MKEMDFHQSKKISAPGGASDAVTTANATNSKKDDDKGRRKQTNLSLK